MMVSTMLSPSDAFDSGQDETTRSVSAKSQTTSSLTEADCEKFRKDVQGFVVQLQRIIESVDASSAVGNEKSIDEDEGDCGGGGATTSTRLAQPSLLEIVRAALQEISSFLETPFGKNASDLFNKYSSQLGLLGLAVNFTQVTTGVVMVNLFLSLANKLLQLKDDDFRLAHISIEKSLAFIREKLPEIKQGVREAGEVFRKIREARETDDKYLYQHLSEFKVVIKTTKLNIKHCEEILESANQHIEAAMRKIAIHTCLNGAVRGALMVVGGGAIFYSCKTNVINTSTGVTLGLFGMLLLFVRMQPQYQKQKEDFLEYKVTQDNLKRRLAFLSEHLKGHEDAFHEYNHGERK